MDGNIAVSKKKQKSFQNSVENYKKLLKSGDIEVDESKTGQEISDKKKARGIVYLSNIPHGFYEEEMKNYFKQFGSVTRIRLARSKNTGKSKGFAFIEFKVPDVAQIVAETMNNYLMCKRLVKAKYIPPDEQHEFYFKGKNWSEKSFPKLKNRKQNIVRVNTSKTDKQTLMFAKRQLKELEKIKQKLLGVGIIYNFVPTDLPKELKLNKDDSTSSDTQNDSDSENIPTLVFNDDSDSELDLSEMSIPSPEQKKSKKGKNNLDDKKLGGIMKKNKKNIRPLLNKDSKKMKLITNSLKSDDTQITLRNKKKVNKITL